MLKASYISDVAAIIILCCNYNKITGINQAYEDVGVSAAKYLKPGRRGIASEAPSSDLGSSLSPASVPNG